MRYLATMNTPGYLPWSDDPPPVFGTPTEAWKYLAEEWERAWDAVGPDDPDEESDYDELSAYADSDHGPDTLILPTPGYDGQHDLGVAYSVFQVPRVAGRCPCCGDDVASMDEGFCCDDCDTAGCEPSGDAGGEVAYWECQQQKETHMHYGANRRLCGADTGREDDTTETIADVTCPDCLIAVKRPVDAPEDDGRRFSCADCGRTDVRTGERIRTHGGFVCTNCREREGYADISSAVGWDPNGCQLCRRVGHPLNEECRP
jgi:hypothetical protein